MKITKTAEKKTQIQLNRSEWLRIGRKGGWLTKTALDPTTPNFTPPPSLTATPSVAQTPDPSKMGPQANSPSAPKDIVAQALEVANTKLMGDYVAKGKLVVELFNQLRPNQKQSIRALINQQDSGVPPAAPKGIV